MIDLWGFLRRRQIPSRVPTDEVLPVHVFDNAIGLRVPICLTLRFDEVLDAQKLVRSLARLAELGDWKKLGGRLRLNGRANLEIHVPRNFTAERPALGFEHVEIDQRIDEHPLSSKLPKITSAEQASIHLGPANFLSLVTGPHSPQKFDDYLFCDTPQLHLFVTSFTDATLISLTWPHTLSDAMGIEVIVKSWCLILNGREDLVPPFLGAYDDPLKLVGSNPAFLGEPYELAGSRLKGLKMLRFLGRSLWGYLWDMLMGTSTATNTVYLPQTMVCAMKQEAIEYISSQTKPENDQKPFLSDGDIITAWLTRLTCQSLPPSTTRPVSIINACDIRSRVSSILLLGKTSESGNGEKDVPLRPVLVGNAFINTCTTIPVKIVCNTPIGELAQRVRSAITTQSTEPQIHAAVHELRKAASGSLPPLYFPPDTFLNIFSSWNKTRLFEIVDFSAAVKSTSTSISSNKRPGSLVHCHMQRLGTSNGGSVNVFVTMGRDCKGNYWITGRTASVVWKQIEIELNKMAPYKIHEV